MDFIIDFLTSRKSFVKKKWSIVLFTLGKFKYFFVHEIAALFAKEAVAKVEKDEAVAK